MSFSPIFDAGPLIPAHTLLTLAAIALGALPKGTIQHHVSGACWIAMMTLVAVSSFIINEFRTFGPFSPIRVLSAVTLWALWSGLAAALRGDIARHREIMWSLYTLALIVTGGFTLSPGRRMHAVIFGG
jgi:uncharacterized membrane protein